MATLSARCRLLSVLALLWLSSLALLPRSLAAQSITEGSLRVDIVGTDGRPIVEANVALLDENSIELQQAKSDFRGRFSVPLLGPGRYSLRVEKTGYQPLLQRGVEVVPSAFTIVLVEIVRRPPPITRVEEVPIANQRISSEVPLLGELAAHNVSPFFSPRVDLTEMAANTANASEPRDERPGLTQAFGGLPQSHSRLMVDGLPVFSFRHPGIEGEPGRAPVFPAYLVQRGQLAPFGLDGEWAGGNSGELAAITRRGADRFRFEPFAFWSGGPGVPKAQNPGDSSLTSFLVGTVASGTLVGGKANFIAGFHYQQLELPVGNPWETDTTTFGGNPIGLTTGINQVARDSFGTSVSRFTRPVVRSSRGGAGGFRVDWRLSPSNTITTRADFARSKEEEPALGRDVLTDAGTRLDSRDFSGAASWTMTSGGTANEFRLGVRTTERDWATPILPTSYFVGPAAGVGGLAGGPANFYRRSIDFSEAFHQAFGRSDQNRFKLGVQYSNGSYTQDYLFAQRGIYTFGDLDQFGQGRGSFLVRESTDPRVKFTVKQVGIFGQVTYRVRPYLALFAGVRFDRQIFPKPNPAKGKAPTVTLDTGFVRLAGLVNNFRPDDNNNIAPRLGLTLEGKGSRPPILTAGYGWEYGELNVARYAEAAVADGDGLIARRGVGALSWPALPDSVAAPSAGRVLTLFSPKDDYKNPRTRKFDLQLDQGFPNGIRARLFGGYHHTDFLLRRDDINLLGSAAGRTQEGRPVYGTLVQQGGLIVAAPGSNRRLAGYDLVSALVSTGYADFYQAGISLSRETTRGLSVTASYLWSRARDNWLQSWTGDPTDELSPFPQDLPGNEWAAGVSDFDVPHRASVLATWRSTGNVPFSLGARYRYRTGYSFTPGFPDGVDANGDGSGRNDPAFVDPALPGMGAIISANSCLKDQVGHFAARNSCRDGANHALDLNASLGLPVRSLGGRLLLMLDVFNLASTTSGLIDRALVRVDPAGTLTTDPQGNVTLPLLSNPNFGKLLARRSDPRILRLGLRLDY